MAEEIKCPKCHSTQISANKKGFSAGKAVAGAVVTGGIGVLAGLHGSSDLVVHCLNCGNSWNPKKLHEEKERVRAQVAQQYKDKWKNEFYGAYESNNMDKAIEILNVHRGAMVKEIGVDGVYKKLKGEDSTELIIKVILALIFFAIVIWFLSCIS